MADTKQPRLEPIPKEIVPPVDPAPEFPACPLRRWREGGDARKLYSRRSTGRCSAGQRPAHAGSAAGTPGTQSAAVRRERQRTRPLASSRPFASLEFNRKTMKSASGKRPPDEAHGPGEETIRPLQTQKFHWQNICCSRAASSAPYAMSSRKCFV